MFLIYRLAESWGMSSSEAFRVLSSTDIMNGYIIPFYDVLHTQGEECLVEEITGLARKRGAHV